MCSESLLFEGLDDLKQECRSFLRFTHAFAPSPLLQPQLASLMTGQEIREHGVRTNGAESVGGSIETVAELAISRRMRTAFYSGGVPLQPKFGISQGFEVFNDSFDSTPGHFFRPFSEVVHHVLRWLDSEVSERSFFLTLYIPDMLSQEMPEESSLDNERPRDRNSRLREVYQTLDVFIAELKKRKRWKNSHVFFLGLGGNSESLEPFNRLGSAYLQVPLQIKLAKGSQTNLRDMGESLLTFAQIGAWVQSLVAHKPSQGRVELQKSSEGVPIPLQSHLWPWLGLSHWPHLGLRFKQYLFTTFRELRGFDSFVDRKEIEPLPEEETQRLAEIFQIQRTLRQAFSNECHFYHLEQDIRKAKCSRGPQVKQELLSELKTLFLWSQRMDQNGKPAKIMQDWVSDMRLGSSSTLMGWVAAQALRQRDWATLFELGENAKKTSWTLVSQLNFRENPNTEVGGCLSYFLDVNKGISDFYKNCQDSELRKIVEGLPLLRQKKKASESFWAQVSSMNQKRRAKIVNLQMLFNNDIDQPFDFAPSLAELYFFLPENSRFLSFLDLQKP